MGVQGFIHSADIARHLLHTSASGWGLREGPVFAFPELRWVNRQFQSCGIMVLSATTPRSSASHPPADGGELERSWLLESHGPTKAESQLCHFLACDLRQFLLPEHSVSASVKWGKEFMVHFLNDIRLLTQCPSKPWALLRPLPFIFSALWFTSTSQQCMGEDRTQAKVRWSLGSSRPPWGQETGSGGL